MWLATLNEMLGDLAKDDFDAAASIVRPSSVSRLLICGLGSVVSNGGLDSFHLWRST
jgi:hypothetical protein